MTTYARFASLLFAGLLAGFLTAVLVLELSLRGFDGTVYTQVRLVELDSLDKLAVATLLPALIATAVLVYRTFRTNTRWLAVAALALLVFVVGLTLVVNLPINSDQLDWNAQSPPSSSAARAGSAEIAATPPTGRSPARSADLRVAYRTRPEQALLYRLTGDRNPLHSDPVFAARGGFDRPILHGMCTYGYTGRALLHAVCGSDPARFKAMEGRFTKSVLPGDELTVSIWVDGNTAYFRTTSNGATVIDRGRLTFTAG
ncbi:MaoC family dehydratase [Phytohabitans rumicis]|uniref:MaoC-like domain-containing protein n=1 Tax=Phytohabitans rumicis TaxID=1076125 RepID=A0A6V8KQY0_9ACTN|nr:MaoC family dehydratase [Phytohabitans rumicis]GFJ87573.1 hypothetical protein Prum_012150 [Phytohabitans rumicis]